jgi:hypothetical protein
VYAFLRVGYLAMQVLMRAAGYHHAVAGRISYWYMRSLDNQIALARHFLFERFCFFFEANSQQKGRLDLGVCVRIMPQVLGCIVRHHYVIVAQVPGQC